jgi:hypothetical protein
MERNHSLIMRDGMYMAVVAEVANDAGNAVLAAKTENIDLDFLPKSLTTQCQGLIESFHDLHGYSCLPNILWQAKLGQFIETEFRQLLRKASTTRSAKKSNESFVQIATSILSLEVLASNFAGWSAIYPDAGSMAHAILRKHGRSPHMPLMDYYLYPPKYVSAAAVTALVPPPSRQSSEADLYRSSTPALSGEKSALNYANAVRRTLQGKPPQPITATPAWNLV